MPIYQESLLATKITLWPGDSSAPKICIKLPNTYYSYTMSLQGFGIGLSLSDIRIL